LEIKPIVDNMQTHSRLISKHHLALLDKTEILVTDEVAVVPPQFGLFLQVFAFEVLGVIDGEGSLLVEFVGG
jgi:hypothetical protein